LSGFGNAIFAAAPETNYAAELLNGPTLAEFKKHTHPCLHFTLHICHRSWLNQPRELHLSNIPGPVLAIIYVYTSEIGCDSDLNRRKYDEIVCAFSYRTSFYWNGYLDAK
jgi:hypothetical protein